MSTMRPAEVGPLRRERAVRLVRTRKAGPLMRAPRSQSDAPVVVANLAPLRDGPAGRLDVRVVEVRPGARRVDIRQFLMSDGYTGHTRKGISLSSEEWDALLEQRDEIVRLLEGGPQ